MTKWRRVLIALPLAAAILGAYAFRPSGPQPAPIRITATSDAPPAQVDAIRSALGFVVARVSSILNTSPIPFHVSLSGSRRGFTQALIRVEGERPQGSWDDAGNIVHGTLPLGPGEGHAFHQLAHVYAEWVFDHLTRNPSDAEPTPAWLYDGLAEVVASRVSAKPFCNLRNTRPLKLSSLASPAKWWRIRGDGGGAVEYCEARTAASRLIDRVGWTTVVRDLHSARSWLGFARLLFTQAADGSGPNPT